MFLDETVMEVTYMSKSLPFDTAPGAAEAGEELRKLKALRPSHLMYLRRHSKGEELRDIAWSAKVSSAAVQKTFETIRTGLGVQTNEEAVALFQRFEDDLED